MHIVKEKRFYINLLTITIPIALQNLISFATSMMDTIMLGRADDTGVFLSASSLANQPFFILSLVCFGLAGASTVLSAQYWGKRDTASIRSIYSIILKVAFVISTLMALAVLIFPQAVMGIYSNNDEIIAAGISYLRIIGFAYILFGLSNTMICCIRSIELVKISVVVNITSFCTNVFLNWVLIFGNLGAPALGIRGAAIATVIGQIFGMALGLWGVFRRQKVLNVNMREFKWRGQTIKDIYRVGLPGIVMQSVVSVMTAGMNGILIAFSQTAVNVLGVYFKLQTFVFMPVFGLNQGALPVMGYNYGARNRKRLMGAYKITLTAAVVIMALGLVLFQLLPEQMLMLFVDKSDAAAAQEMIEVGVPALKTISLSFLGAAFGIINSTLFQATARGMNSLIVSVCRQLVVILPAAWILGQQFGLNAVWYSFPIAEIAAFFISYILLWREYRTELRFLGVEREAKA